MLYKIESGTLYISDINGFKLRKIADSVGFASYDETQKVFLVTFLSGKVEVRDENGFTLRTICKEATEARFQGTNIVVRRKDGRNELRDKVGFQLRWL